MPEKIVVGATAPEFEVTDVDGNLITSENLRGRRTLLVFLRFVGCPTCNLATRDFAVNADALRARGVFVIIFYESSAHNLKKALETWGPLPFTAVPDLERHAYDSYGAESSFFGALVGMTRLADTRRSKSLGLPSGVKTDGKLTRLPAAFLVGPDLAVSHAHYGKDIGDHLTASAAFDWLSGASPQNDHALRSTQNLAVGGAK